MAIDMVYLTGAAPPNRPPSPIPLTRGPADEAREARKSTKDDLKKASWTRGPVDLGAFLFAPGTMRIQPAPSFSRHRYRRYHRANVEFYEGRLYAHGACGEEDINFVDRR